MLIFGPKNNEQVVARLRSEAARFSAVATDLTALAERRILTSSDALFPEEAPLIDMWQISSRPATCLIGASSGHPLLVGSRIVITTSDLVALSETLGWARTRSRWYRLGNKAPAASDY